MLWTGLTSGALVVVHLNESRNSKHDVSRVVAHPHPTTPRASTRGTPACRGAHSNLKQGFRHRARHRQRDTWRDTRTTRGLSRHGLFIFMKTRQKNKLIVRGAFAQNPYIRGPAGPRWRWKLANRRPLRHGELSCPWRSRPRFPSSLRRRAVADPPTVRFLRRTPTW